jgi:diguanylate cyclase (GGDEF)-like protein
MINFNPASARKTPPAPAAAEPAPRVGEGGFVATLEESGKAWFWEIDQSGFLTYISPQAASVLQLAPGERHRLTDLAGTRKDEDGDGIGSERSLAFYLSMAMPFTDLPVSPQGSPSILWSLTGRPVLGPGDEVVGFRGIGMDLAEKTRAEAELRRAARFDALTGLPNRATILKALEDALRVPSAGACALLIVDLDRFKEVNDTHGHLIGDELLKSAADRMRQIASKKGTVGRLGGDEFEIVVPRGCSPDEMQEMAEAIIRYVSIPYRIGERSLAIGASVGIAFAEAGETDAEELFRKADLALYRAKEKRGAARQFEPEMAVCAANRQQLELDLRAALNNGGLHLHLQPIVAGGSEQLAGFEALVRWPHPEQGQIPPSTFIEIAEDAGLIGPLGEWVLRTATREAAKWPGKPFVAVNVSPTQFKDPNFKALVLQALADAGLPAARLELEVTEEVFLSDNPKIDETFAALKRIGVRLALDDFGTGYSSLAYLERAPFDKLKIDRSFVQGACLEGSKNLPILESIVALAHRLDMETTAEGAETHQELELIRRLGCTYVQGFIFGRPMSAEEAARLADTAAPVDADGFTTSRAPRHRLIRRAVLHLGGQTLPIVVRNVSHGGALVEAPRELAAGTCGKLEMQGFNLLEVEVRWSQAKRAGLHFLGEFDLSGLLSGAAAQRIAPPAATG